jgi:hypothetical protein
LALAVARSNQPTRSSSGNVCRRPERAGLKVRRVEVACNRERDHPLAGALDDLAERDRFAVRRRAAELLGELAPRARERILALVQLALRDRPGARVLARPERAAHVPEEHLQLALALAEEQQPGGRRRRQ